MPSRTFNVSTTITIIAERKENRIELIIQNQGAGDLFISDDPSVSATAANPKLGLRCPAGSITSFNERDDPVFVKQQIFAVAAAARRTWVWEARR